MFVRRCSVLLRVASRRALVSVTRRAPARVTVARMVIVGVGVGGAMIATRPYVLLADEPQPAPAEPDKKAPLHDYSGEVFQKVYPLLDKALKVYDSSVTLPEKSLFGKDRRAANAELNKILDEALQALNISELNDTRTEMRKLEDCVARSQQAIAEYRTQQISAPEQLAVPFLGEIGRRLPIAGFMLTKQAYQDFIEAEEANVDAYRRQMEVFRKRFHENARAIGLVASRDSLDTLLESVSGDDVVSMGIVFANVKTITNELCHLTEKSGEAVDIAHRYYGMYVVLLRILDRSQQLFMHKVETEYGPQLQQFAVEAQRNISEARAAMKRLGPLPSDDEEDSNVGRQAVVLNANIEANQLTAEVARRYMGYVEEIRRTVALRQKETQQSVATAVNTYNTVSLSRNVAHLLQRGTQNFDALMALQMPELRLFDNTELRKEFQGLTARIRKQS